LLIGLAVVVFLWGVVKFVTAAGDEEKRKEARQTMLWGVIIFAVIVSIWGLVALLRSVFGIDINDSFTPETPDLAS